MQTISTNANNPPTGRDYTLTLNEIKFSSSINQLNIGNSSLNTGYKNNIGDAKTQTKINNSVANSSFSFQPYNPLKFMPTRTAPPVKKTIASSNMLVSDKFRAPYTVNEHIGKYKGNDVIFRANGKVLINGKSYNLPQSAIDLNNKGNGIGILRTLNMWFAQPDAIGNAIVGGVKKKTIKPADNKTNIQPNSNQTDPVKRILVGAIKSSTVAVAIKGEVAPYGKYTISAYVNIADLKKMLDGRLNPLEVIKRGGFSLTFNKTLISLNKGMIPTESTDSNSVKINPTGGLSYSRGPKETIKTGLVSLELAVGGKLELGKSQVGAILAPKLSLKIPGSEKLVDGFLNVLKKWAERSVAASAFTAPEVIPIELGLIGLITAIERTKPAIAIELSLPLSANLNYTTGKISLATQSGDKITGSLPQLANSFIDVIGLGKYIQLPGGKAH